MFYRNYERKDLALEVKVSNMNGDDAYEAKLVGTFHDKLSYSGVRPKVKLQCACVQFACSNVTVGVKQLRLTTESVSLQDEHE